jgi:nifR3 family TIM-barrel protein
MITSRGLVERDRKTLSMLQFDPGERIRSVQLYGVDPAIMARATEILCNEYGVKHVDLNFGCPVPKVTRKGGGAALPYKRDQLRMILEAAVKAATPYGVPVTIKTRIGIDSDHQTFLDAGRIAEASGCAAIARHGRTAQQAYAGQADWNAIAALKAHVSIPVLGNGDIWEAADALRMIRQTGVDGVVIGRGCLGRPWLFRDLADAFAGRQTQILPNLGEVMRMLRRHAELLVGLSDELHGLSDLRKHMTWYFKGFPVGGELRHRLGMVSSLAELDHLLTRLDPNVSYPSSELGAHLGDVKVRRAHRWRCLTAGWLIRRVVILTWQPRSRASLVVERVTPRAKAWADTMAGHRDGEFVRAHSGSPARPRPGPIVRRELREQYERATLRPGSAFAEGAGNRAVSEEPDDQRTCFERDRIVHSTAFRRLAGKTQVMVFPTDHQRTRLTHALEAAQVAISIARGIGVNVTLVEAIALGHDCGHGPGGHASEDAFDVFIPQGYDHGPWVQTSCCRVSTSAPRPWMESEIIPGRGRRRLPSRATSSAGPTGSPIAPTTWRTPSVPASLRQVIFPVTSSKYAGEPEF